MVAGTSIFLLRLNFSVLTPVSAISLIYNTFRIRRFFLKKKILIFLFTVNNYIIKESQLIAKVRSMVW